MKQLVLSKPITAHGETLRVIELQEPTYDQVAKFGMPFTLTGVGGVRLDAAVALAYVPELAGVPLSSVKQLSPYDIFAVSMGVLAFFTPSTASVSSEHDSTIPPTSGE